MFRWISVGASLLVGIVFWLGAMVLSPYTSWGVEHEHIRHDAAEIGINLAALAICAHLICAVIIYSKPASRKGWLPIILALFLLFFVGTAVARLVWVKFYVLA